MVATSFTPFHCLDHAGMYVLARNTSRRPPLERRVARKLDAAILLGIAL
tara:strand:- start:325 stop:471 length:147 start_codon:yes stop_codon:yes gene_type:complete